MSLWEAFLIAVAGLAALAVIVYVLVMLLMYISDALAVLVRFQRRHSVLVGVMFVVIVTTFAVWFTANQP